MQALRRLVVWLAEILVEAVLLGGVVGLLLLPDAAGAFQRIVVPALAVVFLLLVHGYYLTVGVFAVLWRSQRSWLYPLIAAALFVGHMHFAISRSESDLTLVARSAEGTFLTAGAGIVFTCAFAGNWCLRKWTNSVS